MGSWQAFYKSNAQELWSLLVLPVLFLVWVAVRGRVARGDGVEPRVAGFVRRWAVVFGVLIIADVILTNSFEWALVPFVLLGDYRVFALVLVVMEPTRSRAAVLLEAAAWTLVVPVFAYGTMQLVERVAVPQHPTMLWIVYEVGFVALTDAMVAWLLPRRVGPEREAVRGYVRAVLGFVVLYYVLWALADILTLNGIDRGWALRLVPNQLYYGLFVPFAYWRFFRAQAASSSSTQAAA